MDTTTLITTPFDELRYRLVAERTVAVEDARVGVTVSALVARREAEPARLRERILGVLTRFIAAEWSVALTRRAADPAGYERVAVRAYARVPATEVFNLDARARAAGVEGVALSQIGVDYTLPPERVSAIVHELRGELLAQVQDHIADYEARTGRAWRIGCVDFGVDDAAAHRRTAKGAALDVGEDGGTGAEAAGAERVKLVAEVTLRG